VRIECLVDPSRVGLTRMASVMIDVGRDSSEVSARLAQDPDVSFAMELAGVCNVLVDLVCRDDQHLAEAIGRLKRSPDVAAATPIPLLAMLKRRVHWHGAAVADDRGVKP